MKYLRLFEDNSESKLELVKSVFTDGPSKYFISKYADDLTEDSLKEFNDYIYVVLPGELDSPHISKHFDKNSPGSVWSIGKEEVSKLILDTLSKKPTKVGQDLRGGSPVGPFKYKWLNLEYSKPVGFDSLKKVEGDIKKVADLEPFGLVSAVIKDIAEQKITQEEGWKKITGIASQNAYELVTKDSKEYTEEDLKNNVPCFIKQEIGVIDGDKMQNPTKTYNLVTSKVGEVEGKPVLTLMTIFPGINAVDKNGNDITSKKDFAEAGYAFIKSSTNERISFKLKHLKRFND